MIEFSLFVLFSFSNFAIVVIAEDHTLWALGLDETTSNIISEFIPVLQPIEDSSAPKPFSSKGCIVRKGYYTPSVISACRQFAYDVVISNGTASLVEVILNPGKINGLLMDISSGFRHTLILVDGQTA